MTSKYTRSQSAARGLVLGAAALLPMACAHTMPLPLPSEFREATHGRLRSGAEIDHMRLLEGTHRNRLRVGREQEEVPNFAWATLTRLPPFVYSVLDAANVARSEQRLEDAIRLADSAVGAADHALMSRAEREAVRFRAWRLEAAAWRSLGYLGRARVLAAMASLAEYFDHTAESASYARTFSQTLDALNEAVMARNEAAQVADEASNAAALSAALHTATTVAVAATSSSGTTLDSMVGLAAPIREAESVAREGAFMVTDTDHAISRGTAEQLALLSLDAPELVALTTPLAATARFYLESSSGDCGYLVAAFRQLAVETQWNPRGYDRALDAVEEAAAGAPTCAWTPRLQAALNLVHINAENPEQGRAVSVRAVRTLGERRVRVAAPAAPSDRDEDQITDAEDRCPDVAEDRDGFEDDDGCVDPDNDRDGFGDQADRCPDEPETFNGIVDGDGCPDVFADADGDLLPDPVDACPQAPETYDGRTDDDGCPERSRPLFILEDGFVRPRRPIRVRAGRPLPHDVATVLDVLCAALARRPTHRVVVTAIRPSEADLAVLRVVQAEMLGRGLTPARVVVSAPMEGPLEEPHGNSRRQHRRRATRMTILLRVEPIATAQTTPR